MLEIQAYLHGYQHEGQGYNGVSCNLKKSSLNITKPGRSSLLPTIARTICMITSRKWQATVYYL